MNPLKLWLKVIILMGLLTACAPAQTPESTPTATARASPTVTATASPTASPSPTAAAISSAPTDTPTATRTPLLQQQDTLPTRTPTPTPTASSTPLPGVTCTVSSGDLNLREGPGMNYRVISVLAGGSITQALKQAPGGGWLLVDASQTIGWVYAALVNCPAGVAVLSVAEGVTAQPIAAAAATPTATASPTPVLSLTPAASPVPSIPVGRWRGEYYSNASLLGEPVLVREDDEVDFNWILDSPAPGIPNDNFSVRWSGQFNFLEAGDYRFFANADDGLRLYVDGWLVIDAWHTVIPVDYEGRFANIEPGLHTITVEYFESGGHAHVRVWAERTIFSDDVWRGEYYDNRNLQEPVLFRRDANDIDFNWGDESPEYRLGSDKFSIRWSRTLFFDTGDYKFLVDVAEDDWVRLSIDGWEVLEEYRDSGGTVEGYFGNLGGGFHTVVLEYQEHDEEARVKLRWQQQ